MLDIRKYRHEQDLLRSSLLNFNSVMFILMIAIVIVGFVKVISFEHYMLEDLSSKIAIMTPHHP